MVITSGAENTCIGSRAGQAITTGYENVAVGRYTLPNATTATYCTAVGKSALKIILLVHKLLVSDTTH